MQLSWDFKYTEYSLPTRGFCSKDKVFLKASLTEMTAGSMKAFCFQNVSKLQATTARFRNGSTQIYKTKNTNLNFVFCIQMLISC